MLIGDSICLGYRPLVAERLAGQAIVAGPERNCGDSSSVLKHLDRWVVQEQPALVHLNCGLHDVRRSRADGTYQVDPGRYEANLREIVRRIEAVLVFATTTPVVDERHAERHIGFDRFEADVRRYNEAAKRVMREAGVPVNDLHGVVLTGGPERLLGRDGTHPSPAGNERLAEAVADLVRRQAARLGSHS